MQTVSTSNVATRAVSRAAANTATGGAVLPLGDWHTVGMIGTPLRILLSPPEVGDEERELLLAAFDSGWVAPAGPDIDAFEAELRELTGAPAIAALSSGTAALHLALMAVGVERGDDVLLSTLTFGASAFAVTYLGARPCFVDCDEREWHIDVELLAETLADRAAAGQLPAAVIAVDLYGSVCDGAAIARICAEYEVPYIADAAESVGASRDGRHAGREAAVTVLSFNGNKIVTTGGGGAIMSDDLAVVGRAKYLATQARQSVPWYEHNDIGFNYRMGNLNAAVGRGQLRTLPERIERRTQVRRRYEATLGALPGVSFQEAAPTCRPNHWLTTVRFDPEVFGASTTEIHAALRSHGIEARHGFKPMHLQPVFEGLPVSRGAIATDLFETTLSLPSGARLTDSDVDGICEVIASTR